MNYCTINGQDEKEHKLNLIKWLHAEVVRSSGDGDGLWYSHFYSVNDIFPIVEEFNKTLSHPWKLRLEEKDIIWSNGQEWLHITNNEETFKNSPSWIQVKLIY